MFRPVPLFAAAPAALLAALLASAPALAFEPPGPPPGGEDDPTDIAMGDFEDVADNLKLTAEQRTKVRQLVYDANQARVDIRARSSKAQMELRHLLSADTLDEKAALKAVDNLNAAEADLRKSRVQLVIQLRKVVTAEQWQQLLQMRRDRMRERREEHGGPPPGPPPGE